MVEEDMRLKIDIGKRGEAKREEMATLDMTVIWGLGGGG